MSNNVQQRKYKKNTQVIGQRRSSQKKTPSSSLSWYNINKGRTGENKEVRKEAKGHAISVLYFCGITMPAWAW